MSKKAQPPNKKQEPEKEQEANDKNLEEIDKELRTEPEAERTPGLFSFLLFTITCKK